MMMRTSFFEMLFTPLLLAAPSNSNSAGTKINASRDIKEFPLGWALARLPFDKGLPFSNVLSSLSSSSPSLGVAADEPIAELLLRETDPLLFSVVVKLLPPLSSSELPVNAKFIRVKFFTFSMFWRPY